MFYTDKNTDLHYADIKPVGKGKTARHYRESLKKLSVAVEKFNSKGLDFAVELGDFKDRAVALMRRVEAGVKASMSYCINRTVSISSDPFVFPCGKSAKMVQYRCLITWLRMSANVRQQVRRLAASVSRRGVLQLPH